MKASYKVHPKVHIAYINSRAVRKIPKKISQREYILLKTWEKEKVLPTQQFDQVWRMAEFDIDSAFRYIKFVLENR